MKNKNLQGGFLPLVVIAIIAVLAIGGGTYVVQKNLKTKNASVEGNVDTQANSQADENANENANLGVNANLKAKGSLRSLLGLGQNTMCTFSSTVEGTTSSGTVYIASNGDMSGKFDIKSGTQNTITSNMIVKGDISYVWSGSQGAKMNVAEAKANTNTEGAQGAQSVDLDSQVDYDCSAWVFDESKFAVPTSVNFIDLDAFLKGGIKLPAVN